MKRERLATNFAGGGVSEEPYNQVVSKYCSGSYAIMSVSSFVTERRAA